MDRTQIAATDAVSLNPYFGRLFIDAQYASRRVDSWVSDVDGWSVVLGTRFGNLKPYVSVSRLREPDGDRRIELPENPALDRLSREGIGISFKRNSTDDGSDTGMDVTLLSIAVDFVL